MCFLLPAEFFFEILLTHKEMVLIGGEVLEVIGEDSGILINGISALVKKTQAQPLFMYYVRNDTMKSP
jgi:hypothetical protein